MSNANKRHLFFGLFMLFSFLIPVLIIMLKYKMFEAFFEASTKLQISIIGSILVAIISLVNIKRIMDYLNAMPLSTFKCIINGIVKLIPLACVLLILVNMEKLIDDLTFVTSWVLGCNAISFFVFEPLWRHYNNEAIIDKEYKAWKRRDMNGV